MISYTRGEAFSLSIAVGILGFFVGTGSSPFSFDKFTELTGFLAWPATILTLVLLFRPALAKLLNNLAIRMKDINSYKGLGGEFSFQRSSESDKEKIETFTDGHTLGPLTGRGSNAILALEKQLMESAEGITATPEEKLKIAIRDIAISRLQAACFDTYNIIYLSQIEFLFSIALGSQRSPIQDARTFYEQGVARDPEHYKNYRFENWLNFMAVEDLIKVHDDTLNINFKGEYFLQFLVDFSQPWKNKWR